MKNIINEWNNFISEEEQITSEQVTPEFDITTIVSSAISNILDDPEFSNLNTVVFDDDKMSIFADKLSNEIKVQLRTVGTQIRQSVTNKVTQALTGK